MCDTTLKIVLYVMPIVTCLFSSRGSYQFNGNKSKNVAVKMSLFCKRLRSRRWKISQFFSLFLLAWLFGFCGSKRNYHFIIILWNRWGGAFRSIFPFLKLFNRSLDQLHFWRKKAKTCLKGQVFRTFTKRCCGTR